MPEIDDDEFMGEEADGVSAYFCDAHHLHIVLTDDGGNDIAGITLDLEDGVDLVRELMREIEEMTGLMFVLVEPKDGDIDTIGETMGNA